MREPFAQRPVAPPRLSVIVSTFERPDALRLVLEGYAHSTFRDFEVIVADDGSADETDAMVEAIAKESPFPLTRVWQPHDGFRLAAARNLAVRSARGNVLVFTDGDCIPLPPALEPHASACAPGVALTGDRLILTREETERLIAGAMPVDDAAAHARARELPRLRRQRWKNRFYGLTRWKPRPKLLTANAAVHREDFERVNGFDERFVGWGYEDEDLSRRLRRVGVIVRDASLESLMLHLFHPVHESHRPHARAGANYAYFKTGEFLTRPLRGLRSRMVEDLALEILGDVPPGLTELSASLGNAPPEVSVALEGKRLPGARPRGEVVLRLPEGESQTCPEMLYQLLRDRL